MKFTPRKDIRLKDYDYSSPGAYFITICTQNRACILSEIVEQCTPSDDDEFVGAAIGRPIEVRLGYIGTVVEWAILNISQIYPMVSVKSYVIMPNHVHMLLQIYADANGRAVVSTSISSIINKFKGYVSKQVGYSIWQKRFMEHIIRDEDDYITKLNYIQENPTRWFYNQARDE